MNLEKEFEVRKAQHMINTVQLYLTHMYFNRVEGDNNRPNIPYPVVQMAIAEQVVNDIDGIVLSGKLPEEYTKADRYLINHDLDIDDFVTRI